MPTRTLLSVIDENPTAFGAAAGSSRPPLPIGSRESVRLLVALQNGRPILSSV